jgi:wyosine [tRNA(Phe)-imidazoG37] synthetase (radical SAM superfamily)
MLQNHNQDALRESFRKGMALCRAVAPRVHRLSVNLNCCEGEEASECKALHNLLTESTGVVRSLSTLDQAQVERLFLEWSRVWPEASDPLVTMDEWAQKLKMLSLLLRRVQLHITMKQRLKEPTRIISKSEPELSPEEVQELKHLNAQMLYSQIALGEIHVEAVGTRMNLDPTSVCNVRCVTCYQNYSEHFEPYVLPAEALDKAFEALPFVMRLDIFGGGEPTLSKQLPDLCHQASRYRVSTNLLTNGTLLNRRELPLEQLHSVTISWDGGTADTLEKIRLGVPFDATLQSIRELRVRAPHLQLAFNVTVNRANVDELTSIVELAADVGLQRVHLTRMHGPAHLKPLILTVNDIERFENELGRARRIGVEKGVEVVSLIHYEGLQEATEPLDKRGLLEHFVSRPAVNRSSTNSVQSLLAQLHSLGSFDPPLTLPEWATSLSAPPLAAHLFEYDLSSLRARVEAKLEQLRRTPSDQLIVPFCMSPWVHNFVTASGGLRPCCVMGADYGDLTHDGNMLEHLNSPAFTSLRAGLLGKAEHPTPCQGCTFIERYHSVPEYLGFLEAQGKSPEDLRFPDQYQPPHYIKIRPRKEVLEIQKVMWRVITSKEQSPIPEDDFNILTRSGEIHPRDAAFLSSDGRWYRAAWMAEASSMPSIATSLTEVTHPEGKAKQLIQALWQRVRRVEPCSISEASLQLDDRHTARARIVFTNSTEGWLWGFGARVDASDAIGLRFLDSDGRQMYEGRLLFSHECVPPGATRAVAGVVQWCGAAPEPGRYTAEFDVVRESVNWSLPENERLRLDITVGEI